MSDFNELLFKYFCEGARCAALHRLPAERAGRGQNCGARRSRGRPGSCGGGRAAPLLRLPVQLLVQQALAYYVKKIWKNHLEDKVKREQQLTHVLSDLLLADRSKQSPN